MDESNIKYIPLQTIVLAKNETLKELHPNFQMILNHVFYDLEKGNINRDGVSYMNTEVIFILKNLRFLIIRMNNEYFILDKDKPYLLVLLFPFLYWIFPKRMIKISTETVKDLQTIASHQAKNGAVNMIGVGLSLILANIIGPLLDYLNVELTTLTSIFIFSLITVVLILLRLIVSIRNKQALYKKINFGELMEYKTIWTMPKSFKSISLLIFGTFFCWAFIIVTFSAFMMHGNVFMIIGYIVFLFLLLYLNLMTVLPGLNTMRIWMKK